MELLKEIIALFLQYVWLANLIFIIVILLFEKKAPTYTLFWIFLLILLPYVGFFIYLFLGMSFTKQRLADKIYVTKKNKKIFSANKKNLLKWEKLVTYSEITSKNNISTNNKLDFFMSGKEFFSELKKGIISAKKSINMEYFIFHFDEIGKEIANLLLEKSKEGIEVKIIIDGLNKDNRKLKNFFKNSDVKIYFFFKSWIPFFNLRINYRDHKKITIIDSKLGFIGGINIGDEYLGKSKVGNWRDTALKIEGSGVFDLEKEFYFSLGIVLKEYINYEIKEEDYKNTILENDKNKYCTQVISSGPNYEYRVLRDTFITMIKEAKEYIYIQSPYFAIDDFLLDILKTAILSGVNVKIMIPNKADHLFVYWVNQFYVGQLLEIGAEIYRYDNGFLHSKTILVDGDIVSVGTCNFDYRSFYHNFEINLNIYEKDVAEIFKKQFFKDLIFCKKLTKKDFEKRSLFSKLKESIFRLLSPLL